LIARQSSRALDGKYRATLAEQFGDTALVLPAYGAFVPADSGSGISSGWVFADASPIKIKDSDTGHGSGLGLWATGKAFTPVDVAFSVPIVVSRLTKCS